jgi:hypothetical protein|nr:hypothetical protein [uncultured Comamonas sp.]
MFKKKPPAITIGSSLGATPSRSLGAVPFAPGALTTSVQPSAIAKAGDALGNLIWKTAPIVKAVALGTAAMAIGSGDAEPDEGAPWLYTEHYDDLQWRWHREND